MAERVDPCSLSNPESFLCKHISWQIDVDFPGKVLRCTANLKVECVKTGSDTLILDTNGFIIHNVCLEETGKDLLYIIENETEPFGKPLEIKIPEDCRKTPGLIFHVKIVYETTSESSAIDWLEPEQTSGKQHPFLFTQCQAIHARSIIPCQDTPAVKFTYDAEVTVPSELTALMSAIKDCNEIIENDSRKCRFHQKTAIPSYLLALVAGSLEGRDVGPRSKVWAEKDLIEKCAYEFAELESMVCAAESICGPYVWGRYDLLVLPPSFPYGGMENPCLTFVTPTLLAGDRSLTGVAAHEIAHSWTGNLVTNKTWEHFWLNEGFTRFVESKIIGKLRGEKSRNLQAIGGWKALIDSIDKFGANNPLTALVPDLEGIDPDEAFSSVPYEKGFAFLYYLEHLSGGPDVFNEFLRSYIDHFKYQSITTDEFQSYLFSFFKSKGKDDLFSGVDWKLWFHNPGMPPLDVSKLYDTTAIDRCNELANRWLQTKTFEEFSSDDLQEFCSNQIIEFLSKLLLEENISKETLKAMNSKYNLTSLENNEIKFRWLRLCVRAELEEMYPQVVKFITQQGRMKYIRPIYSEMYKKETSRGLAIETFQDNMSRYHTIAATMVAKDLHLIENKTA
ncbi:leukotriene A-4 hydrolase-like [Rhopilema esculentum]|uniref:leukotriene A-4 hydrolase-like n=1 Tax=Rhopilema esculentum TaxID=499914 RepID=UPI0031D65B3A